MRRAAPLAILILLGSPPIQNPLLGQAAPFTRSVFTLHSQLLDEERRIHVDVPAECAGRACPVALVLDAEFVFPVAAGVQHLLSHRFVGRTAPAILVGVENTDRLRDTTPTATGRFPGGGGAARFIDFLVTELLPEIDRRHATEGRPVLLGHSGAGLVALLALSATPGTFRAIAPIDPSVDWDDGVIIREVREWIEHGGSSPPTALALDTYRLKPSLGDLVRALESAPSGMSVTVAVHEGETHQTLLVPALRRVLPLLLPAPPA